MDTMVFMRGDGADHTFAMPAANWQAGGRLFFAAKIAIDDDATDALALIQCNWDDSAVSDVTIDGLPYKQYACHFPASATDTITGDGAETADLLGEFQWVPAGGLAPTTFPGPGQSRIPVSLSFDVKRKTVL